MNPCKPTPWLIVAVFTLTVSGCTGTASRSELLRTDESQVTLRSIQTRAFDTSDRNQTLRAIVATLQDLDFVLDDANEQLGTVSGTKLKGYRLKMTVTVRARGESQLLVRANAQFGVKAIEEAGPYQDFFTALEKSMFLSAHAVD